LTPGAALLSCDGWPGDWPRKLSLDKGDALKRSRYDLYHFSEGLCESEAFFVAGHRGGAVFENSTA
jgi:hypothetical protein